MFCFLSAMAFHLYLFLFKLVPLLLLSESRYVRPTFPGKWKSGHCSTLGVASLGEARISEREQRYDEQF
jgi:hypothetical protein